MFFDVMTGEVRDYTMYPKILDFSITTNWYPLYDHNGEYMGSILDGKYMTLKQIRDKWGIFNGITIC
jgi:hypothetical protein